MNVDQVLQLLEADARLFNFKDGEPRFGQVLEQQKWAASARLVACSSALVGVAQGHPWASTALVEAYTKITETWPVQ